MLSKSKCLFFFHKKTQQYNKHHVTMLYMYMYLGMLLVLKLSGNIQSKHNVI